MELKMIAPNQVVVTTDKAKILFSYDTPVCAYSYLDGFVKSDKFYSATTTRHINKWVDGRPIKTISQSEFDALLS